MSESSTDTTPYGVGGGYGQILGDPLRGGGVEKVAVPGAVREVHGLTEVRPLGLLEDGRFTSDEIYDILECRNILGDDFPSMFGPRDVVWPRL